MGKGSKMKKTITLTRVDGKGDMIIKTNTILGLMRMKQGGSKVMVTQEFNSPFNLTVTQNISWIQSEMGFRRVKAISKQSKMIDATQLWLN